jgi:RNA polymerase sigma factor (sigma-70 family)
MSIIVMQAHVFPHRGRPVPDPAGPPVTPEALFAWLWPDLARYCGRVSGSLARTTGADRDDLFQAGAVAVWRDLAAGTLAESGDLKAFACRRAKLAMYGALRADRRRHWARVVALDEFAHAPALAVTDRDPDEWGTLLGLIPGETDRRAVEARFRDDATFAEIGATMGVSRAAVRERVNRVLGELAGRVG